MMRFVIWNMDTCKPESQPMSWRAACRAIRAFGDRFSLVQA